jgi:peptidoglycan/xylan/chitin deacetylase (PgdA/CDA1 family)
MKFLPVDGLSVTRILSWFVTECEFMRWNKRLNNKGKIAVSVLCALMIFILFGLFGSKGGAAEDVSFASLGTLSVSFQPMVSLADSNLNQSAVEKEKQEKEEARQQVFAQRNKLDKEENAIYLTFDDGPSESADALLNVLDDYNMTATFFMLGPNMKTDPQIVKRMKKEGFGLALHSMTHNVSEVYSSSSAPTEEMRGAQEILENITGDRSNIVRLPYGSVPYLTEEMRSLLNQNDFDIWDWNVDSRDWELLDERYVQHTIQEIEKVERAGETPVVLLHDKKETVAHLPKLLSYIQKRGYKTKALDEKVAPITFPCEGRCK